MLVYTPKLHPRIDYILRWMFSMSGEEVRVTSDSRVFLDGNGLRIWYSNEACPVSGVAVFSNVDVLWSDELTKLQPTVCYKNTMAYPDLDGSNRFDPFASCFFLLSRFEEYSASEFDEHGRFSGRMAWGGEELLMFPWADIWRKEVHDTLALLYPNFRSDVAPLRSVASIDIDSAFAYRYKGVRRTMGAVVLDILRFKPLNAYKRLKCVLANEVDPFDTYENILDTCLSQQIELRCFFLLADRSRYDINIDFRTPQLHERIEDMHDGGATVGIHPGYESHNDVRVLAKEIGRLQSILGEKIQHSRQHFLKFRLPVTYRRLLECGITHDHSMGYADFPGFRAGTAHPFKWFDVERNETTALNIHPIIVMDSTLHTYRALNPSQAMEVIAQLRASMRKTGGDFVSLWHNETVAEQGDWKGWRVVWEEAIK